MSVSSEKMIGEYESVPIIDDCVFCSSESRNKQFALGIISANEVHDFHPGSIPEAYLRLRFNCTSHLIGYHDNHGEIETDNNDERSSHYIVVENKVGKIAIFACMRLIEKTRMNNTALPIEVYFSEYFNEPAPIDSVEFSRLFICHADYDKRLVVKRALMVAGLAYATHKRLNPMYGVVNPIQEKSLMYMGVPVKRVTEPKLTPPQNTVNVGLEIDQGEFGRRTCKETIDRMPVESDSPYLYWGNI